MMHQDKAEFCFDLYYIFHAQICYCPDDKTPKVMMPKFS